MCSMLPHVIERKIDVPPVVAIERPQLKVSSTKPTAEESTILQVFSFCEVAAGDAVDTFAGFNCLAFSFARS
jgi:hypothetical protein